MLDIWLSPTTLRTNVNRGIECDSATNATINCVRVLASDRARNKMSKRKALLRPCRDLPLWLWGRHETVGAHASSDDETDTGSRNESGDVHQSNQDAAG